MPPVAIKTTSESRTYPKLAPLPGQKTEPMSFVVVHFSDEYKHNILASECVQQAANELITIDNRGNCKFENLSQAINAGIKQATQEIIVVVHEDVLLPMHWEQHLFRAIAEIENTHIPWGLLGAVGWMTGPNKIQKVEMVGHWSDPLTYYNTFTSEYFQEVGSLDEHIMIMRRSHGARLDPHLPSIHNIGIDLPLTLQQQGLSTIVINAPTIHKYADASGGLIRQATDSTKILDRKSLAYLANKSLSDDYLEQKWLKPHRGRPGDSEQAQSDPAKSGLFQSLARKTGNLRQRMLPPLRPVIPTNSARTKGQARRPEIPACDLPDVLRSPILLAAKGGGGSRLLSALADDLGIFIGAQVNDSGDALEFVQTVYRGVLRRCLPRTFGQDDTATILELRQTARDFVPLGQLRWGFKLPESMLILEQLLAAFPDARVLHFVRDPLTTCLRRTHMTARLDNQIGRATVPWAYRHCGRQPALAHKDPDFVRSAYCTRAQLESALSTLETLAETRALQLRFEDVISTPRLVVQQAAQWLNVEPVGNSLEAMVSADRATPRLDDKDQDTANTAEQILTDLRCRLGYS